MSVEVGDIFKCTVRGSWAGKPNMQVSHWRIAAASDVPVGYNELATAMWLHLREELRAFPTTTYNTLFQECRVDTVNKAIEEFGIHSIPTGEQGGTRSAASNAETLASFTAAPLQLLVSTKATRAGSKRPTGLVEGDVNGNTINTPLYETLMAIAEKYATESELGIPALAVRVQPVIFRDGKGVSPHVWQPITGFSVRMRPTTQNTRKVR